MYVYKNYVCALWVSSPLAVYDAIDNTSSSRAHEDWEIATERLAMLATRACLATKKDWNRISWPHPLVYENQSQYYDKMAIVAYAIVSCGLLLLYVL